MKMIEFRTNEKLALNKMTKYRIDLPPSDKFPIVIEETVSRNHFPWELYLGEVSNDELIYIEEI
jgi:hypothetical protein